MQAWREEAQVSLQAPLWRSIAVFRCASLVYAAFLLVVERSNYAHFGWAWGVLAAMGAWTLVSSLAYAVPARRTWPLLAGDLTLTAVALLSTAALQHPASIDKAAMPLTTAYRSTALNASVLLLLAGIVVGYVSLLATGAERALQRATELEAASRERERLARHIHDSVLQVLALVHRRGAEVGGEAADPVLLAEAAAAETAAAVRAALDNVRRHCGEDARAWVLVDDEGATVNITVRDEGPGIPAGRLEQAAAEGRLGVSQAICGRIRDLGGSAYVSSTPAAGTEVRLRVPRRENVA
jgi:signal transduction histidine kinase